MEKECFGQPIFPGALSDQLSSPFEVGSVRDGTIPGAGGGGRTPLLASTLLCPLGSQDPLYTVPLQLAPGGLGLSHTP